MKNFFRNYWPFLIFAIGLIVFAASLAWGQSPSPNAGATVHREDSPRAATPSPASTPAPTSHASQALSASESPVTKLVATPAPEEFVKGYDQITALSELIAKIEIETGLKALRARQIQMVNELRNQMPPGWTYNAAQKTFDPPAPRIEGPPPPAPAAKPAPAPAPAPAAKEESWGWEVLV